MRIGSAEIATGKAWRDLQKKQGKRGSLKEDQELKALKDYEDFQKRAFEAMWMGKIAAGASLDSLREVRSELNFALAQMANEGDSVRRRRLGAELWAINRILGREEGP